MNNSELLKKYNKSQKRGTTASEMCRRAGTIKYLLKYCIDDDKKFQSCMNDTISALSKRLAKNY